MAFGMRKRGIRSSGKPIKMVDYAQGWQGVETLGRPCADTCSMGSANVELVRAIFADWERGDFTSAEWADPDIEYEYADGPWPGVAGMAERVRAVLAAWRDLRIYVDEYRELDDERVLVLVRRSGRGRASGLELDEL
jgi:hypothetical protein